MTEDNRRIRELTESRAALERRLGELSEENDRLRTARDELFAAHKVERDARQRLEMLVAKVKEDVIAPITGSSGRKIGTDVIRTRAVGWEQAAARVLGQDRS